MGVGGGRGTATAARWRRAGWKVKVGTARVETEGRRPMGDRVAGWDDVGFKEGGQCCDGDGDGAQRRPRAASQRLAVVGSSGGSPAARDDASCDGRATPPPPRHHRSPTRPPQRSHRAIYHPKWGPRALGVRPTTHTSDCRWCNLPDRVGCQMDPVAGQRVAARRRPSMPSTFMVAGAEDWSAR